ncbi:ribonuclease domain-containing protein [Butyrivibrio sp. AE2032]|uniref:ribonuclease domain-containing protein n=1 Tax=Butyrivibrio sp. AE2032 TaxID=1458463 RepID=UPI000ACA797C|nr:ribonuclease domain-containing protein [Butyrivibrio sp. AE2032]
MLFALMALLLVGCGKKTQEAQAPSQQVELAVVADGAETKVTSRENSGSVGTSSEEGSGAENTETVGDSGSSEPQVVAVSDDLPDEDGIYTDKDELALYIHTYGHLPSNFITKKEAKALGWSGGSVEDYAEGKSIGGDRFGNYEGLLPDGKYYECDVDTLGKKSRGAKRLIYSKDGAVWYTEDHYETFEQLYEPRDN